ncbi:unnamed protein product, partial [Didymodactylos carnosus]
ISHLWDIMTQTEVETTDKNKDAIESKIQNYVVKYKAKFQDWRKNHSFPHLKQNFETIAILKSELPDVKVGQVRPKTPKRMTRDFSEVGPRQKRNRRADLNSTLDNFARDNNIPVNQVLGWLIHQRNYNANKHLAKIGDELYRTGDIGESSKVKLDLDKAVALKTHINLSCNDFDFERIESAGTFSILQIYIVDCLLDRIQLYVIQLSDHTRKEKKIKIM